jgi:multiple sugar transport system permease protein
MKAKGLRRYLSLTAQYCIMVAIVAVFLIPIYTMVTMSFKTPIEVIQNPPNLFAHLSWVNYRSVLFGDKLEGAPFVSGADIAFGRALLNSLLISVTATTLALLCGVPAAYVLARHEFKGKRNVAMFVLSTRFAPPLAVLIPFYILFSKLHLLDTHLALIIMYTMMNLSLVVWMMMGYIRELPRELEESAQVDGCTRVSALRYVTLPLVAPGLAATTIFTVMTSWNEFVFAVMLTSQAARTAPVAALAYILYMFVAWGPLTAAGTLITIPVLIFVLIFQQRLVRGLTMGAIRG